MKHALPEKQAELAAIIRELIARLKEAGDDGVVGPVSPDLCVEAAGLAAILGFPCPPLENFAIKRGDGKYDRLLATNSKYEYVTGLRCHSPSGREHGTLYTQAYRKRGVLDKSKLPDELSRDSRSAHHATIVRILGWWQRAVDALDTGSVQHSRQNLRQPENTVEAFVFNGSLYRELGETVQYASGPAARKRQQALVELVRSSSKESQDQRTCEFAAEYEPVIHRSQGKRKAPSCNEANIRARELLQSDPSFADGTQLEWAEAIECSEGLVAKLPIRKEIMLRRTANKQGKRPNAVHLSEKVVASHPVNNDPAVLAETEEIMAKVIAAARTHEERERLRNFTPAECQDIAEVYSDQEADYELSPLEHDPPGSRTRTTQIRKQL